MGWILDLAKDLCSLTMDGIIMFFFSFTFVFVQSSDSGFETNLGKRRKVRFLICITVGLFGDSRM